jgi:hypothetical protein
MSVVSALAGRATKTAARVATGKVVLALAGALIGVILILGTWLWLRGVRLDAARDDVRTLTEQVTSLAESLRGAAAANADWERLHGAAVARVEQCHADLDRIGESNGNALAAAAKRAAAAAASMAAWRDRYRSATADPGCASLLATPVCPALQEDVP